MSRIKEKIKEIAHQYGLQIIYAFGSRAKEALDLVEGRIGRFSSKPSDLDMGVKPEKPMTVEEKVKIAILFEDLFDVTRVDLIILPIPFHPRSAVVIPKDLAFSWGCNEENA